MEHDEAHEHVNRILHYVTDYATGDQILPSAEWIEELTGISSLTEYFTDATYYENRYSSLANMYGFYTFYGFLFFLESDNQLFKNKDGKIPVKRTVTFNGKQVERTYYVNAEEAEPTEEEKPSSGGGGSKGHASEHQGKVKGKKEEISPKEIAKWTKLAEKMVQEHQSFSTDCDRYLVVDSEEGIVGLAGYTIEDDTLSLVFYKSVDAVSGMGKRAFYEGIQMALDEQLDYEVFHDEQGASLFEKVGMTHNEETNTWTVSYEELNQLYGHSD